VPRHLQYIDLDPRQLRIDTALTPRWEMMPDMQGRSTENHAGCTMSLDWEGR